MLDVVPSLTHISGFAGSCSNRDLLFRLPDARDEKAEQFHSNVLRQTSLIWSDRDLTDLLRILDNLPRLDTLKLKLMEGETTPKFPESAYTLSQIKALALACPLETVSPLLGLLPNLTELNYKPDDEVSWEACSLYMSAFVDALPSSIQYLTLCTTRTGKLLFTPARVKSLLNSVQVGVLRISQRHATPADPNGITVRAYEDFRAMFPFPRQNPQNFYLLSSQDHSYANGRSPAYVLPVFTRTWLSR